MIIKSLRKALKAENLHEGFGEYNNIQIRDNEVGLMVLALFMAERSVFVNRAMYLRGFMKGEKFLS
jgi:hypothetical protein